MKAWTRWQDWVSLVLGVLLFISPWVFGTATNTPGSWNAWIVGVLGVILALWALAMVGTAVIAEWISLVLAVTLARMFLYNFIVIGIIEELPEPLPFIKDVVDILMCSITGRNDGFSQNTPDTCRCRFIAHTAD